MSFSIEQEKEGDSTRETVGGNGAIPLYFTQKKKKGK